MIYCFAARVTCDYIRQQHIGARDPYVAAAVSKTTVGIIKIHVRCFVFG